MRSSSLIFIGGLLANILIDFALWYQLRQYLRKKWPMILFIIHSLFFMAALLLFHLFISRLKGPDGYFWIGKLIGVIFLFYAPKFIFVLINGIGRLFRRINLGISRSISVIAALLSGALFFMLLYGITLGRYNFKVETVKVPVKNLPEAFRGFKIVQLADLHLGSYGESYQGIHRLVEEVNQLHPDLIVFTGDMVNNFADEMPIWIRDFQQLQAPFGKYAVTGNHDYGDYTHWPTSAAKENNLTRFFQNMKAMGFHMLNNSRVPLISGNDTLWLAGVENWGKPPFPRYGRLAEALDSLRNDQCVILLSHDPSHWREEILQHPVPLTLSGHTHAMQLGIKIGQKEWSPAQYLYPEYDGLYQEKDQFLYVSRGQGYLGFPGRIGLRPVITELILIDNPL